MKRSRNDLLVAWLQGSLRHRYYDEIKDQIEGFSAEQEKNAIDELQLDPMVDFYTDQLFEWLTVLMSEPKYLFMAPAVIEAIAQDLRSKNAAGWSDERTEAQANKSIRYLEALICDSFCRGRPEPKGVIGNRIWRDLTDGGRETLSRDLILNRGGIQKTIGMHPTPRYISRAAVVFTGNRHRMSAVETILNYVKDARPEPWWTTTIKLAPLVKNYAHKFNTWLGSQNPKLDTHSLALTPGERRLLGDSLFGTNKDRKPWQRFLIHAYDNLRSDDEITPSRFLKDLLPGLDSDLVPQVKAAAAIAEAVGVVRFVYNSKLAKRDTESKILPKLNKLINLALPKQLPADASSLGPAGLEFLKSCQRAAGRKQPLIQVLRLIAKREKDVKGERAKIYLVKSGAILVRQDEVWSTEDANKLKYSEPPMRIQNARSMLKRLNYLRSIG